MPTPNATLQMSLAFMSSKPHACLWLLVARHCFRSLQDEVLADVWQKLQTVAILK